MTRPNLPAPPILDLPAPRDAFNTPHAEYPRAGVRRRAGYSYVTIWAGPDELIPCPTTATTQWQAHKDAIMFASRRIYWERGGDNPRPKATRPA